MDHAVSSELLFAETSNKNTAFDFYRVHPITLPTVSTTAAIT
jgi:hypothetical protein